MTKRKKRKRQSKSQPGRGLRLFRRPTVDLDYTFSRVNKLIDQGRPQEAIALLEPLLASKSRTPDLHYYLGYARVKAGDLWGGLDGYEQAMKLSRDPGYWLPLSSLYLELGLTVHALHAFRRMLKEQTAGPLVDEARQTTALLEQDVMGTARHLGLSEAQMEKGLRYLEEGQRALHRSDYSGCIAANRRAIKLLGDWPPPHNNLSLAIFFNGQPEEAIAVARRVLSQEPDNLQALSNTIRFLAWTGQKAEARQVWSRLREITPQETGDRLKKAEAAAILDEDESVYQTLKPLDKPDAAPPGAWREIQLYLAIAEANTGRHRSAQRRLKTLQENTPWTGDLLAALKAGRPGPGWVERFPYFHSSEVMPRRKMEEFIELIGRQDKISARRFRKQLDRFIAGFPQIVLMAEKLIWEENQAETGIAFLEIIATPPAYAALRRFGLSQAGDDEVRQQALFKLLQAGQIDQDETLRIWSDGEWREVQLRQYEITDEPETFYSPEVADLLNQGLQAFKKNNYQKAEQLFQRALALEPRAKEAYNNLGTIYSHRKERERAKEMFQAALEIDPTYVFPLGNLAIYLLDDNDVEGAKTMLAPLADVTRLRPQEMAFYSYIQARILMHEEEYEAARNTLEVALKIWPGYKLAESLLDRLETVTVVTRGWESFMERQRRRDQAKRARLQAKLATPDPSLSEALALYSKDVLTGMARVVLPHGGWSGLRKAELLQEIVKGLNDQDNLERLTSHLNDDERTALRQVLEGGGNMPWPEFDARYGNDLEESAYWNWHVPETLMGRLRLRGLLVEATVDGELLVVVPPELRQVLREILLD